MLKGRILHILKTSSLIVVFACLLGAILWWLPNVLSYETNTTKDWVVSKGASSSENSYVKLSEVEARIKIDAQNGENVNYAAAPVYSPPLSTNSSSLSSSQLYESSAVTMHSLGGGTCNRKIQRGIEQRKHHKKVMLLLPCCLIETGSWHRQHPMHKPMDGRWWMDMPIYWRAETKRIRGQCRK